jgi:hypothetical protein
MVVEMIMVVVILVLVTIGLVQFGNLFANAQQVALAARVGAEEASQTSLAATVDGGPVPNAVIDAVRHQLESSGIEFCHIRLEHNVGGVKVLESDGTVACDCSPAQSLAAPPPGEYVRLTVCVPLAEVMPQEESFLGAMFYGPNRTYEHTATFRHE